MQTSKSLFYLRFALSSKSDLDDGEDGGDAEAAPAGRVRLDDPEGNPRTHHHHEQRSVNLETPKTFHQKFISLKTQNA